MEKLLVKRLASLLTYSLGVVWVEERRGNGFGRRRWWWWEEDEESDARRQKTVFSGDEGTDGGSIERFEWDDFDFERWECVLLLVDGRDSIQLGEKNIRSKAPNTCSTSGSRCFIFCFTLSAASNRQNDVIVVSIDGCRRGHHRDIIVRLRSIVGFRVRRIERRLTDGHDERLIISIVIIVQLRGIVIDTSFDLHWLRCRNRFHAWRGVDFYREEAEKTFRAVRIHFSIDYHSIAQWQQSFPMLPHQNRYVIDTNYPWLGDVEWRALKFHFPAREKRIAIYPWSPRISPACSTVFPYCRYCCLEWRSFRLVHRSGRTECHAFALRETTMYSDSTRIHDRFVRSNVIYARERSHRRSCSTSSRTFDCRARRRETLDNEKEEVVKRNGRWESVPRSSQCLRVLSSTPVTFAIWSSKCETIWPFFRLNCANTRRALRDKVFTLLRPATKLIRCGSLTTRVTISLPLTFSFDRLDEEASRNAFKYATAMSRQSLSKDHLTLSHTCIWVGSGGRT